MKMQYKMLIDQEEVIIGVKRSDRKTIGLEVKSDGEILVRAPRLMPEREVEKFIEKYKGWLTDKVRLARTRRNEIEEKRFPKERELAKEERKVIARKLAERVQLYSEKMNISYGNITIRNQKTRWGSCSSKGNLNFNYRLYYLPEELLDYVVVHELAHRRHMNHSKGFWEEVEKYMPDYKERRKRLKEIHIC